MLLVGVKAKDLVFVVLDLFQVRCGIARQAILASQPAKPDTQRNQHAVLRSKAQWLTVPLAIVKQMALVLFEGGSGDLLWILKALVRTPADKDPELLPACRDGLLRVLSHGQSV